MLLHPITIDAQNVERFMALCPLHSRQRLLMNAKHYPPGLNAVSVADANGTPLGLAFTLRNPDTDNEILQSLHSSAPEPEGWEVLGALLRHLIEQGRSRQSRCITASVFFTEENGVSTPLPDSKILLQLFADAGFENPVPFKVIYKISIALITFQREKYQFSPEGLEYRFVSYKEWGEPLPEQLPPYPPELSPLTPGCDPVISQLLVKDEKICGWLTARRISPQSVYYQTLFVDENIRKHYAAPLLIRRAAAMQIENQYSEFAVFSTPVDNSELMKIFSRYREECCVEIVQESTSVKLL